MASEKAMARAMRATAERKVRKLEHELLAGKVESRLLKAMEEEGDTIVGYEEVEAYDVFGNALGMLRWAEIEPTREGGLRLLSGYEGSTIVCTDLTLLNDTTLERILEQLPQDNVIGTKY